MGSHELGPALVIGHGDVQANAVGFCPDRCAEKPVTWDERCVSVGGHT
jgi:hypothetical protein